MATIRSQTPLRLGLVDGGADINLYRDAYTGYVLNATVSLFVYCTLIEGEDNKIIFDSPDTGGYCEYRSTLSLENDGKLDTFKTVYNRIVKDYAKKPSSSSLRTYSDVPSGSSLGGNSTLVTGMLEVYAKWFNLPLGEYKIAKLVYETKREDLGIVGGAQDQYVTASRGFNFVEFYADKRVIVSPLHIRNCIVSKLESRVVPCSTDIIREAGDVEEYKKGRSGNQKSLEAMHDIKRDAIDMKEALFRTDFKKLGVILERSWRSKETTNEIVNSDELDRVYRLAVNNGAYSGEISGAGAGSFMFFLCEPTQKYRLCELLNKQGGYVANFSFTKEGAKSWRV